MLISVADIIQNSYELYKKHWRKMLVYLIFLLLPTIILSLFGIAAVFLTVYAPALTLTTNLIIVAIFAISLVFSLWVSIALAKEIQTLLTGQTEAGWKAVFSSSSALIWPVIYTSLLVAVIVFATSLLLIIPGIIFAVWYSFVFYTVILEQQKGRAALRASKELVAGRWWSICWRLIAPSLLFGIIAFLIQYLLLIPINYFISSQPIEALANSLLSALINTLLAPLTVAATVILYLSAKENPVDLKR